jgi:hypothetical protein
MGVAFRPEGPGDNSQAQRAWESNNKNDSLALKGRARFRCYSAKLHVAAKHERNRQQDV